MITSKQKTIIINNLVSLLELPDSAYEKAINRYEDLGKWFDREESALSKNNIHIFPQGSFRLGTAIRPLNNSEEYDLDLACKAREGISKNTHTQEELKELIGAELEAYRKARRIQKTLKSKHRCWRLEYQDDISFHMDIVPCIPSDEKLRKALLSSMQNTGLDNITANAASQTSVSITDDRHKGFRQICYDWNISNPEGYAFWFESKMKFRQESSTTLKAQIDNIPLYKRKTPLQSVIQILKRHRDNWSKSNPDSKPISIIITTLAARAYKGETDISEALQNILENMDTFINPTIPRIPNPVDPQEDFADRWYDRNCLHLNLEQNFRTWLMQAQRDFQHLTSTTNPEFIYQQMGEKFSVQTNQTMLAKQLGVNDTNVATIITPIPYIIEQKTTPKPWRY